VVVLRTTTVAWNGTDTRHLWTDVHHLITVNRLLLGDQIVAMQSAERAINYKEPWTVTKISLIGPGRFKVEGNFLTSRNPELVLHLTPSDLVQIRRDTRFQTERGSR
jgi:hypothetical protein